MPCRRALHSGSWYSSSYSQLDSQLSGWLHAATIEAAPARAIISPHAGYRYCGACAAYAYKQIIPSNIHRVFILGPSHHLNIGDKCALTSADTYETPLYNLKIDGDVYNELIRNGDFAELSISQDEDEHSIEMQLPYIAKTMERHKDFTIVPILVGNLSVQREVNYGQLLAPYLADPQNLFVISSDFCHWGRRFQYTHYDKSAGAIWQSIENLDRMGMKTIESLNPSAFTDYLRQYSNTICGRRAISVLLQAVDVLSHPADSRQQFELRFVQYAQSDRCKTMDDSSVSYAAASLTIQ